MSGCVRTGRPAEGNVAGMNDAHPDLLGSPGVRAFERELAMLGHLVARPELPALTRLLILDAMLLWTPLAPLPPVTAAPPYGTAVGCFLRDVRLLLDLYLDYAPDDHECQILSNVHRMLGLAQYSLVDPASADAGQHRWQQQDNHVAGLRADELDAALHLGLAEHRRRHSW